MSQRAAIVLRCGVTPLGPTTDQCVTVTDDGGASVDWVVTADGSGPSGSWVFMTYGRTPAVEVTVPKQLAGDRPDGLLVDIGAAVHPIAPTRSCL